MQHARQLDITRVLGPPQHLGARIDLGHIGTQRRQTHFMFLKNRLERRRAAPRREGPLGGQRSTRSDQRGGYVIAQ